MATRTEFSNIDGLLEVRHAEREGNVYAAFLFSDEGKAAEAVEQVWSKKIEEHSQEKSTANRSLSPLQECCVNLKTQDSLWTREGECAPESIVVFSAFQGDDPKMREIPTSEELVKRVAKIMPQGSSAGDVSVVRDLNGIHIKR